MEFDPLGVWVAQASQGRKIVAEKGVGLKSAREGPNSTLLSWSNCLEPGALSFEARGFPQAMGGAAISIRLRPLRLAA